MAKVAPSDQLARNTIVPTNKVTLLSLVSAACPTTRISVVNTMSTCNTIASIDAHHENNDSLLLLNQLFIHISLEGWGSVAIPVQLAQLPI